jgi:hypothetical protein
MRLFLAIILGSLVLSGCATLTKGTLQPVAINTPGVPGATCEVGSADVKPVQVVTPAVVTLQKAGLDLVVTCWKECYETSQRTIKSSIQPMVAGNILVGGLVGVGVDAISGAGNEYEGGADVAMRPIPGCRPKLASG